jgi:hypothetical protein
MWKSSWAQSSMALWLTPLIEEEVVGKPAVPKGLANQGVDVFAPGNKSIVTATGTDVSVFAPGNKGHIVVKAEDYASDNDVDVAIAFGDAIADANASADASATAKVFAPGNKGTIDASASADADALALALALSINGDADASATANATQPLMREPEQYRCTAMRRAAPGKLLPPKAMF